MSTLGKRSRKGSVALKDNDEQVRPNKKPKTGGHKDSNDDGLDSSLRPITSANQVVVLNVGGVKYTTTIQTLLGFESMLKARFSGNYSMKPQNDGSYFFDRDGRLFEYILEYLRTGNIVIPKLWTKGDLLKLHQEAQYFAVESLRDLLSLKFFDSNILTHDVLKRKIIRKMKEAMPKICESTVMFKQLMGKDMFQGIMGIRDICSTAKWTLQYNYNVADSKANHKGSKEELERFVNNSEFSLLLMTTEHSYIYGQFMSSELSEFDTEFSGTVNNTLIFSLRNRSNMDRLDDPISDIQYVYEYNEMPQQDEISHIVNIQNDRDMFDVQPMKGFGNSPFGIFSYRKSDNIGGFLVVDDKQRHSLNIEKIEVWRIPSMRLRD